MLEGHRQKPKDYSKTVTTTTVTTTEYYDKKTGTIKKKSISRTSSMTNDRRGSITNNRRNSIANDRTGSITSNNNKKYKYLPTSKGLKLVEVDEREEDEKFKTNQARKQASLVRRSESNISLRSHLQQHKQQQQQQPVRQPSNLSVNRSNSIQSRQSHAKIERVNSIQSRQSYAKIERANSGLAAAKVATGAQDTTKLNTSTIKKRKSMATMKSATNNVNGTVMLKKNPSFIKEESPSQLSKDAKPENSSTTTTKKKTIKRAPSVRKGLSINEMKNEPKPQRTTSIANNTILEQPPSVKKKNIKITPMKVALKPSMDNIAVKENVKLPKEKNEKDKVFLKFQESAGDSLKEDEKKVLNVDHPPVSEGQIENGDLNSKEELTDVSVNGTTTPLKEFATEDTTVHDDDNKLVQEIVPEKKNVEDDSSLETIPVVNKKETVIEQKEPVVDKKETITEQKENIEIPIVDKKDVAPAQDIINEVKEKDVPEPTVNLQKEEDIVKPLDTVEENDTQLPGPPIIQLAGNGEHMEVNSPSRKGFKLASESKESIYLDSYENVDFKPPGPIFAEKTPVNNKKTNNNNNANNNYSKEDESNKYITPTKEKPLKSAIRSRSKYDASTSSSKKKADKTNGVGKSPAQDAYLKLTTAENTRLNSQLQDSNQRQSKIVRSPSKRMSLRVQPPAPASKKGGSSMTQRMKPSPIVSSSSSSNGQYNYVHRKPTKPNMNITLEAPELTPLEKKSSFEKERSSTRLGFGNMSMREEHDHINLHEDHHHNNNGSNGDEFMHNFKSRFVDSDDEFDLPPQPVSTPSKAKYVPTMRNGDGKMAKQKILKKVGADEEPEKKKKTFGGKLKKLFGKKKQ